MVKVRIDAGHSPSCVNGGASGYKEYLGMWKLSNYLKEILEGYGVKADLTRNYNDDPKLYTRGKMAQGYDLFISEHSNAGGGKGVEVIRDINKPIDEAFAKELTEAVAKVMNTATRKVMTRTYIENGKVINYYGVIRGASATNCKHNFIIENGFHDNASDEAFLKVDENLKKIAQVQAEIICKYLGVTINNIEVYKKYVQAQAGLGNEAISYMEKYAYANGTFEELYNGIMKKTYASWYTNLEITLENAIIILGRIGLETVTINYFRKYPTYGDILVIKLAKACVRKQ